MKHCSPLAIGLFLLLWTGFIGGGRLQARQDKPKLVSLELAGRSIDKIVQELTAQTGFRFFYDPAQFDTLSVDAEIVKKTLPEALDRLFRNTPFHYAIDEQRNAVFLTKDFSINTTMRIEKAGEKRPSAQVPGSPPSLIPDFNGPATVAVPKATLENKLYEIGSQRAAGPSGKVSLAGYVYDVKSGEPLAGVTLYIENPRIGVSTNQFGFYSIILPAGRQILIIQGVGVKDTRRQLVLNSDGKLNIEVQEQLYSLKEVVISAEKASNISRTTMGLEKLDIKSIKQVPTVFGEPDVLRVVLTLPGVKSVGEASNGFNVRGGSSDQNLVLFNDATVYNPFHFFGFFSAFNPDAVKDVELYKSSIPTRYGGRLASVLQVNSREGNKKKFTGTVGLGLITSRINVEGPIVKDKTSFILGARTTYSNWLLQMLPESSGYKGSKASFSDINLQLSHRANEKDNIDFTGYISQDNSNLGTDTTFSYANLNASLKWKHVFNNKFFSVLTGGVDRYQHANNSSSEPLNTYRMHFDINQGNVKADFTYYPTTKHTLDFGLSSIFYKLHPGSLDPGAQSLLSPNTVPAERALESALYLSDHFTVTPAFTLDYGVRFSMFNNLGPQKVYRYAPGLAVNEHNVTDSITYGGGDVTKTYKGPEIRVSGRLTFTPDFSIKAGYNTLRQYIHVLSNTTTISPTDIWKLSDANIRPQYGKQVSFGIYKNFKSNTVETSAEVYYKRIKDFLDYKSGAVLTLNHTIERDVMSTLGKAYGLELMIKKLTGKMNGWVSYTWSRTLLKMDDPTSATVINEGNWYPANYDKPHDFTMIGNFRFSHRFSTSLNVTYSTGRPVTLPSARFSYAGSPRIYYSERNAYRVPDYFRSDFSMNIEGNHKIHQLFHNSWSLGIYNITGRKNAYSTYYSSANGVIKGYKLIIFGTQVPFINYNMRF